MFISSNTFLSERDQFGQIQFPLVGDYDTKYAMLEYHYISPFTRHQDMGHFDS